MASGYTAEHASALRVVASKGAAATFTRAVAGTVSDTTDAETGATTLSIPGSAIEDEPDKEMYRALGLTHLNAVSLFFAPDTLGTIPQSGDTVSWGGRTLSVKGIRAYDFDGQGAIAATVVCQR